jgi:CheY-like chemotaxis protein
VFEIYLPVSNEISNSDFASIPEPRSKGKETVLFIDDEEEIVSLIRQGLAQFGYQVSGFSNPVEALMHLRLNPGKFDMIITDRNMPHMTGEMVAREVSNIVPDLPVILCTGTTEELSRDELEALGFIGVVNKPYSPLELGTAIRKSLDTGLNNYLTHKKKIQISSEETMAHE